MQVESVAWITELKNTLSAVFYLGAMLIYLRFDQTRKLRWYLAALGLFVLALFSKTVTATLPAALLVIFWWQRGRLVVEARRAAAGAVLPAGRGRGHAHGLGRADADRRRGPEFDLHDRSSGC